MLWLRPNKVLSGNVCFDLLLLCSVQSAASQNGSSAAQIDNNGKASHAAVVQAVVAESNGRRVHSNGTAALQNGAAAAAYQNGSATVEDLKDAATIVSVTENVAVGADSEQNGAWADPCEVGHLDSCAADRYSLMPIPATRYTMPAPSFDALGACTLHYLQGNFSAGQGASSATLLRD